MGRSSLTTSSTRMFTSHWWTRRGKSSGLTQRRPSRHPSTLKLGSTDWRSKESPEGPDNQPRRARNRSLERTYSQGGQAKVIAATPGSCCPHGTPHRQKPTAEEDA